MTTTFTAVQPRPARPATGPLDPVPTVRAAELRPGSLHALFRSGASVVRIQEPTGLDELWHDLVFSAERRGLPWHDSVQRLASSASRSGRALHQEVGNVLHARPGEVNYVGRQWRIGGEPLGSGDPAEQRAQQVARQLALALHAAMLPAQAPSSCPADTTLQCIRYFDSPEDGLRVTRLLESALLTDSRFARWGLRVDRAKTEARGLFRLPLVADLYGMLRTLPALGPLLGACNSVFWLPHDREVPADYTLVGAPHVDSKFFGAITSIRDSVRTEYFDGYDWHELEVDRESLCVMPGRHASEFGLRPTLHRVLQGRSEADRGPSLSLVLGTVPSLMTRSQRRS